MVRQARASQWTSARAATEAEIMVLRGADLSRSAERDEARDLLAPVYGWFTEGFNTRDLKGAKELLDELAA